MSSVSKQAAKEIASSGVIDACYSELWGDEPTLMNMYWVLFDKRQAGGNDMKTIFACYMNYDYGLHNYGKAFNTPRHSAHGCIYFRFGRISSRTRHWWQYALQRIFPKQKSPHG